MKTLIILASLLVSSNIMAFDLEPIENANHRFTQICIKSESEGSGTKSESEGSGTKSESEGSGTKSESEGSGTKSESEGSGINSSRYCLLIRKNNNFMK